MSIGSEIVIILILILINGVLAMSEAALVASRKARLQQKESEGNKSAALAIKLLSDPNIFLSAVQIGITLIGVLAGAVGGATISEKLASVLINVPYIGEYSEPVALTIVVLIITVLSLWL
jgi:putative hemolysin